MSKNGGKVCLECSEKISGRVDKKFCSDACRVSYNNRLNSDETNLIRNVNNSLRKNRRILKKLNTSGTVRVKREKLTQHGFDFNYFTSTYVTQEQATYYYCYEQGYRAIEKDYYLLVIKKDF